MDRLKLVVSQRSEIGTRDKQQDALRATDPALYPDTGFMAVLCDGMGGMKNGDVYSKAGIDAMAKAFEKAESDLCGQLLAMYGKARTAALAAQPDPENPEGGSTLVAVTIADGKMAFISSGDSRIYLYRGGGLIQLNREQVFARALDEGAAVGKLTFEEARAYTVRRTLTNHLCEVENKPCDRCTTPVALRPGDRVLLTTDGVFGTLTDKEIEEALKKEAASAADSIVEKVQKKSVATQDNYSLILIHIKKA